MQIAEIQEVSFVAMVRVGSAAVSRTKVGPGLDVVTGSLDGGMLTLKGKFGDIAHVPLTNVAYLVPKAADKVAPKK